MLWNWQHPDWPVFRFDADRVAQQERELLLSIGNASCYLKEIEKEEHRQFVIEILGTEGEKSARIEGEILDRESLQSSIKRHFGLTVPAKPQRVKETGMARLLCAVYESYDKPLSHATLEQWHRLLFQGTLIECDLGHYRTHEEPMQIVSHRLDVVQVFFEAPPSKRIPVEMDRFIAWFNSSKHLPLIVKAALAHLYFESIHPFEDGNGRIGRALVEKSLSQGIGRPILIAMSKVLEKRKKEYYKALEACNHTLDATGWIVFFADALLQAQKESLELLHFIIGKSKLFTQLQERLNPRQKKALLRLFQEGPNGFEGGLSADKYIAITQASRATATRDLLELVEWGALYKTGELRHTRYWLNL